MDFMLAVNASPASCTCTLIPADCSEAQHSRVVATASVLARVTVALVDIYVTISAIPPIRTRAKVVSHTISARGVLVDFSTIAPRAFVNVSLAVVAFVSDPAMAAVGVN